MDTVKSHYITDKELMQMLLARGLGSEELTKLYKETKEENEKNSEIAAARAALVQATIDYINVLVPGAESVDKEAVEAEIADMEKRLQKLNKNTDNFVNYIKKMGW